MKTRLFPLAALSLATSLSFADAPDSPPILNITSPTAADGVIYVGVFPATVPIMYTVLATGASDLGSLTQLDVRVKMGNDTTSLYGGQLNPFTNDNACVALLTAGGNTCLSDGSKYASLSVPWEITAVGNYEILVTARYRNEAGTDQEAVTVALSLAAEYPAPPAVANAYINAGAGGLTLTGKQRGCVISKIAEQHGKFETYNAKGGPYDIPLIQAAVGNFATVCPAR